MEYRKPSGDRTTKIDTGHTADRKEAGDSDYTASNSIRWEVNLLKRDPGGGQSFGLTKGAFSIHSRHTCGGVSGQSCEVIKGGKGGNFSVRIKSLSAETSVWIGL